MYTRESRAPQNICQGFPHTLTSKTRHTPQNHPSTYHSTPSVYSRESQPIRCIIESFIFIFAQRLDGRIGSINPTMSGQHNTNVPLGPSSNASITREPTMGNLMNPVSTDMSTTGTATPVKKVPPPLDTMRAYRACLNCRSRKSKCDLDINGGRPVSQIQNSFFCVFSFSSVVTALHETASIVD